VDPVEVRKKTGSRAQTGVVNNRIRNLPRAQTRKTKSKKKSSAGLIGKKKCCHSNEPIKKLDSRVGRRWQSRSTYPDTSKQVREAKKIKAKYLEGRLRKTALIQISLLTKSEMATLKNRNLGHGSFCLYNNFEMENRSSLLKKLPGFGTIAEMLGIPSCGFPSSVKKGRPCRQISAT